jgi:hypothetical protein
MISDPLADRLAPAMQSVSLNALSGGLLPNDGELFRRPVGRIPSPPGLSAGGLSL